MEFFNDVYIGMNGREIMMSGGETDATKCKNAEVHRVNGLYRYAETRNS